jgi:hypothetical protein
MLKYSKSGRFLGFVREATGRPVETAPFARRREAQEDLAGRTLSAPPPARPAAEGDRWKAAIALGVEMAESEARYMVGAESPAGTLELAPEKAGVNPRGERAWIFKLRRLPTSESAGLFGLTPSDFSTSRLGISRSADPQSRACANALAPRRQCRFHASHGCGLDTSRKARNAPGRLP